jgi:hypothetical protein
MTYNEAWLGEVYSLLETNKMRKAIDVVFDNIDNLCCEQKFEEIDEILSKADLDRLDENLIVAFLTISFGAKNYIKQRASFYEKAKLKLLGSENENVVKEILNGLE